MNPLGGDRIIVQRAPLATADRYHQQSRDWTNAVTHVVDGCSVQLLITTEADQQREYIATRLTVWAPPNADILGTDRVLFNGLTYEVDGDPFVWRDLAGIDDHTQLILKRWTG